MKTLTIGFAWVLGVLSAAAAQPGLFGIHVVDEATGRGVPLVELKTVNQVPYYTDSAGWVAFDEPGLFDRKVFFSVRSHGYEFAKDGFGSVGRALDVKAGGTAELKIKRLNIAERMYRLTGGGIYRDSVLLGRPVPIREPLLNGQVFGQDSALAAVYRGKAFWFWGDTLRPSYPLGHFATAGATAALPGRGGLDPEVGVNFTYFTGGDGFSRPVCPVKRPGPALVWIDGVCTVADASGAEKLICHYAIMKSLGEMLGHGVAVWSDERALFESVREIPLDEKHGTPRGHPTDLVEGGRAMRVFNHPWPVVRAPAKLESVLDPQAYESFTCLKAGTRYAKGSSTVEHGADGRVVWGWKRGTDPVGQKEEKELIAAGLVPKTEARFQLCDAAGGKDVALHDGSFRWNPHRKRWVMIGLQHGGTSLLGEVWYAEADAITGPWRKAVKIVTHEKYSFYNPVHHDFLDRDGGRYIFFEGTYAETFSGAPQATPRYDYNQMMYRLDLDDPRLTPARE